jgi:hemerythrin-like domain-containing protein
MNIVDLLKRQHQEVKTLLERIIEGDDKKEGKRLLGEVGKALRLHMQIEEKMVYPAAARAFQGEEEEEEQVLEAFEEHATARRSLEVLEKTPTNDKRFIVRAKVLKELILHHVEEEEEEMFPDMEEKLGDEGLQKLGNQVERRMPQLERDVATSKRPTRARPAARRGEATRRTGASGRAAKTSRTGTGAGRGRRTQRKGG